MTAVKTISGEQILIKVSDGATPPTFAHRCMINGDRSIDFSSQTTDTVVPDCDNPSLPGWVQRDKDGLSSTIDGGGLMHVDDVQFYWNWFKSNATKDVRASAADGTKKWSGAYHCTAFSVTGTRKKKAEVKITLMSDGEVTYG